MAETQTIYRVNAKQTHSQGQREGRVQGTGQGRAQGPSQGHGDTRGDGRRVGSTEKVPLPGEDKARQVALAMTQMNMNIPGRKKGTIIGALAGGSGGEEIISHFNIFLWNRDQGEEK